MNRLLLRALVLGISFLSLAACISVPKQQAYNREMHSSVKRIQILPMAPKPVELFIFNNPGYSFGLIGAAIAEANRNSKENWVQKTVSEAGFSHSALFRERFSAAMLERGYELVWPDTASDTGKVKRDLFGLRKKYSAVSGADAQLDLGLTFVGFAAAGSGDGQPYRPTMNMSVRLLTADGKTVLFSDMVLYHNVTNNKTAIILEPDPRYAYPDFDDLEAAGASTIEGLRLAVEETARAVANQL